MEESGGGSPKPSSKLKQILKRKPSSAYSRQKTLCLQEPSGNREQERLYTLPSQQPSGQKSTTPQIHRKVKRKSMAEVLSLKTTESEQDAAKELVGKHRSSASKQQNRKSIQIYSSQQFFRKYLNDRTTEQQRAMRSQWKYLGKYGGQFQKMGLKALANLAVKRLPRKLSLPSRNYSSFQLEEWARS